MPRITQKQIAGFNNTRPQLKTLLRTMEELAKKKPDGPLNRFKITHTNEILDSVNEILGESYRPFNEFMRFDIDGELPTASDVVMVLAQYVDRMKKFEDEHTVYVDNPEDPELGKVTLWNMY